MTDTMTLSGEDHAAVSRDTSAVTAPTQFIETRLEKWRC
jgi:hypothetical protein